MSASWLYPWIGSDKVDKKQQKYKKKTLSLQLGFQRENSVNWIHLCNKPIFFSSFSVFLLFFNLFFFFYICVQRIHSCVSTSSSSPLCNLVSSHLFGVSSFSCFAVVTSFFYLYSILPMEFCLPWKILPVYWTIETWTTYWSLATSMLHSFLQVQLTFQLDHWIVHQLGGVQPFSLMIMFLKILNPVTW